MREVMTPYPISRAFYLSALAPKAEVKSLHRIGVPRVEQQLRLARAADHEQFSPEALHGAG